MNIRRLAVLAITLMMALSVGVPNAQALRGGEPSSGGGGSSSSPNQDDPAQNEGNCTAVGGSYDGTGGTKTCTVIDDSANYSYEKPAGKSGRSWNFDYTYEVTTIYTRTGNDSDSSTSTETSSSCINPAGKEITEDLPDHCLVP
jgi:hypothetical protein